MVVRRWRRRLATTAHRIQLSCFWRHAGGRRSRRGTCLRPLRASTKASQRRSYLGRGAHSGQRCSFAWEAVVRHGPSSPRAHCSGSASSHPTWAGGRWVVSQLFRVGCWLRWRPWPSSEAARSVWPAPDRCSGWASRRGSASMTATATGHGRGARLRACVAAVARVRRRGGVAGGGPAGRHCRAHERDPHAPRSDAARPARREPGGGRVGGRRDRHTHFRRSWSSSPLLST